MVPVYVRGGSWSNIEDQTLKAAVSKYGFNQWHRVASLLPRKTAKQAKARWHEFLDPRIRKTEWTHKEDVQLLELARLRPNQWRSIASTVGRTATQCVERYQKLLDDEGSNDLALSGPGIETLESIGASKGLQIGDINMNAETKEARPDTEALDEDEREMLSEARARLANTRGKKATRKARERMLEESKRIALLQKRRDLKQAGITTKLRAPKKKMARQMDYTKDVPFEHVPLSGFYDTTEEVIANERHLKKFERQVDKDGVKDDPKREKTKKRQTKTDSSIEKEAIPTAEPFKKRKLELPEPIFTDNEILKLSDEVIDTLSTERTANTKDISDKKLFEMARKIKESKVERSALLTIAKSENFGDDTNQSDGVKTSQSKMPDPKLTLKEKLARLPKPKNDFEILEDEKIDTEKVAKTQNMLVEDEGEKERLRLVSEETERQKALLRRSQSIQKSLPIPNVDSSLVLNSLDKTSIGSLIDNELLSLIKSDFSKLQKISGVPFVEDLDETSKLAVEAEIEKEINLDDLVRFQQEFSAAHRTSNALDDTIDRVSLIDELSQLIEKGQVLEKKLEVKFGGYIKRNDYLLDKSFELIKNLKEADRALCAFNMLRENEKVALHLRSESLKEQVNHLSQAKHRAHERYLELKHELEPQK